MSIPFITAHAIERYRERVDPSADRRTVIRAIRSIVETARVRSRPRHWTCVEARPGHRYLYSALHPGICLVLRGGAVITVFSRTTCARWREELNPQMQDRTTRPYKRPPTGSPIWPEEAA